MSISSKKGDSGYTSLLRGDRVPKHHLAIEAVGTLDEANSLLGLARASSKEKRIKRIILQVQKHLFIIGAELSVLKGGRTSPKKKISETDIKWLERLVEGFEESLALPPGFVAFGKKFVIDVEKQISVQEFADSIQAIHRDYPKENLYVLQNLMDSHDVDRLASQIVNPDRWYDHEAHPGQNEAYNIRKPNETERKKQRLIVAMQMTMPGAPMIYYGDEAGMWGGDDPDCRKPMVWPELEYETETAHPLGKSRPADEVYFDEDLFDWYRKLIGIRKSNPSLSLGEIEFFLLDEKTKFLDIAAVLKMSRSLSLSIIDRPLQLCNWLCSMNLPLKMSSGI